ncbi:hypothetical protein RSOLAG22IIIB_06853 [Rhizoctonia solani]|uniref:Uncharacterized protein n=1 Tax=Rhizoctonia solani TaxID=456999 RepID=A0A0K6GHF8_9AGAM|nr:hypothetical protein RSOLAG22IIIB_06853 [Rhizoctonia solani]
MFSSAHRYIPGQLGYIGHNRRINTANDSSTSSPYHGSHHFAQQADRFTRSSHRASPIPDYSSPTDSTQSSPGTGAHSPAPSSSGSSSSAKSVRWGESDSDEVARISPKSSVGSSKPHPKPVLKYRALHVVNSPSLFGEKTQKIAASAAIDTVLCELATCIKNFKAPSELVFASSIMVLAKVEENRLFIDQLCKRQKLSQKLAKIPPHGNEQLEATRAAISRALSWMKEHQIILGMKFICTALDKLAIEVRICVGLCVPPPRTFNARSGYLMPHSHRDLKPVYL